MYAITQKSSITTSVHRRSIITNTGSKPNELSGFGCKKMRGLNMVYSLTTNEKSVLLHILMLLTNAKI